MTASQPIMTINGQPQPYVPLTLSELLRRQGIDPQRPGIAVAVNAQVVSRSQWEQRTLQPGDRVEIVQAQAGG